MCQVIKVVIYNKLRYLFDLRIAVINPPLKVVILWLSIYFSFLFVLEES